MSDEALGVLAIGMSILIVWADDFARALLEMLR